MKKEKQKKTSIYRDGACIKGKGTDNGKSFKRCTVEVFASTD